MHHLSRRSVGWGSAGLVPKGGCDSWTMCRRVPSPDVGMLQGIIFQQMGAGGGTFLCFFQPASPTALAALSFILGQRLLIFPFLAFLTVAVGVKQCLGHFPSSAATRAGAESCSVGGQQVLWGVICSPHCNLTGSVLSRVQVHSAGAHLPPRCLPRGCSICGGWVLVLLCTASLHAERIFSMAGIFSTVTLLKDLWKKSVFHGAICCPETQDMACVLPYLQRQDAW